MRSGAVLVGLSLLVGCQSNQAIDLPSLEGARSYFIAGFGTAEDGDPSQPIVQGTLRPRFAEAFDEGNAAAFTHVREDLSSIELQAYPCSLEEMGLRSGPLELGTAPRQNGPALPVAVGAWSLGAAADHFVATSPGLPGPLDDAFNYWQVSSLCERAAPLLTKENAFREVGFDGPTFDIPLAAVEYPPGEVLMLTQTGRLFQVPRSGGARTSTLAISKRTVGMAQAEDGAIWALDEAGSLHLVAEDGTVTHFPGHAHVAEAKTATISNVGPLGFVALDSGGSSDPSELYAVADDRVLMHYDGQDWQTLLSSELKGWKLNLSMDFDYTFPYLPRLVRLGPDSLVVNGLGDEERKVVFWEDGHARVVPIEGAGIISALLDHPAFGLLAGDLDGHIYRYVVEERRFELFASSGGAEVITLAGDASTLWFTSFRELHTYDPLAGICTIRVREAGAVQFPFRGEWVLGSLQLEGGDYVFAEIDWVKAQRSAVRCEGYIAP